MMELAIDDLGRVLLSEAEAADYLENHITVEQERIGLLCQQTGVDFISAINMLQLIRDLEAAFPKGVEALEQAYIANCAWPISDGLRDAILRGDHPLCFGCGEIPSDMLAEGEGERVPRPHWGGCPKRITPQ